MANTSSLAWSEIVRVAFSGNQRMKTGRPRVITKVTTGAPSDSVPIGTLCWNEYDSDAYIATDAAGTWVQINA